MAIHVETVEAQFDVSPDHPAPGAGQGSPPAPSEDETERLRPYVLEILSREIESILRR